ncbi:MAG: hypothetical protein GY950_11745 [bacterium]|nr:hypothetical protein [bacterium]
MRQKQKAILSILGLILFTWVIHSYIRENQRDIDYPEILYGIPTYPGSRISYPMSMMTADPYTAVFLSNDPYEKVIEFYKDKLAMDYKELKYGKGSAVVMTIYQFEMKKGILKNQINKGVEIIPFNHFNRRVYKAATKIKIIIPQDEVKGLTTDKEEK